MTATESTVRSEIRPRRTGFIQDVVTIAIRSIRQLPRDISFIVPTLFIPLFFLVINVGSLSEAAEFTNLEISYREFQLPVAIVFAVTGVSRAPAMVLDIQNGYFDRLMATPVSRRALLLGHMMADFVLVVCLSIPVVILGFVIGARFDSGPLGVVLFIFMAALWGIAFTGIPYSIALKTGNPGAVNSSFIIFFPFAFITTAYLPLEFMSGWLAEAARYNPVTYLLGGLRSLFTGWDGAEIGKAFLAIGALAALTQTLSFRALKGRVDAS
ncbi:MAG: ABC transporter permease [Actinomycetota bacterium]